MAKMSKRQLRRAKSLAERMKGERGMISNPHALARYMVKRGRGRSRR